MEDAAECRRDLGVSRLTCLGGGCMEDGGAVRPQCDEQLPAPYVADTAEEEYIEGLPEPEVVMELAEALEEMGEDYTIHTLTMLILSGGYSPYLTGDVVEMIEVWIYTGYLMVEGAEGGTDEDVIKVARGGGRLSISDKRPPTLPTSGGG